MATEAYRDFRSASRTKHRERARKIKYRSFRNIHASDLPSKTNSTSQPPHTQQEHYLPVCACTECPWEGTTKVPPCVTFPADLSTAPVAKFTPREAYQAVSHYPYPGRRHHVDKHKDFAKQARQRHFKNLAKREIREDPRWENDLFEERMADDEIDSIDEAEQYLFFGKRPEMFEVWAPFTEHGETLRRWCEARGTTPNEHWKQYLATLPSHKRGTYWEGREFSWSWHRNDTGCWEFDLWGCHCWDCWCPEKGKGKCREYTDMAGCFVEWGDWTPEGPQRYSLARWCKGMLKHGVLWDDEDEEEEESGGDLGWDVFLKGASADCCQDGMEDWDVVSVASSAWTEIEEAENAELEFAK
jgi:hypothetical protein